MKKTANSDVIVIVPTLNEEEGIGRTLQELGEVLESPFYLVVDGRSVDRTVEIAREKGAKVVVQEGRGKGLAMAKALKYVNAGTRYVVFIDGDHTYPAGYVPKMIEVLEENPNVGMVMGNRFNDSFELKAMGDAYYWGNRFLALMQYLVNGIKLRDPLTGLRVVRWKILKDWNPKSGGFDVEAELNYFVERKGFRIVETPIEYRKRLGEKKLKLRHGFTILKRILSESLISFFG